MPLFDPPRTDAAETIAQARQHGIQVKMVTGDNVAIAWQIAGQLGLGTHILPAEQVFLSQAQVSVHPFKRDCWTSTLAWSAGRPVGRDAWDWSTLCSFT